MRHKKTQMRDNLKKVIAGILLLMLALAAISTLFRWHHASNIQQELAETRRTLREQGFKTDLADFNLTTDAATRARESELMSLSVYVRFATPSQVINLLPAAADGSAVVLLKQDWLKSASGNVTWSDLHDALEEQHAQLDAACDAALSGPIQFDLDASRGRSMLLSHLAPLRNLGQTLSIRTLVELHDGNPDAAWTNLLALTRLATAWNVEPTEVSHMIQSTLVGFSFNAAWQALQQDHWPDEKLAALQREWESADFFTNLADTVAFQRASDVALCQLQRQQPLTGGVPVSEIVKESVRAPGAAFAAIRQAWNTARYRSYGTFDDEKNMLLFYQKREIDMRHSISPTWAQMQALPGVTNAPVFMSSYQSPMMSAMSLHVTSMRLMTQNSSLLARAATAETRRRIIVTAIALERFRQKHGAYPQTLAALVPEFLKAAPVDFMDGQPLRYRLTGDGHFVLYSVGLDCVDNGGKLSLPPSPSTRGLGMSPAAADEDIVWPRPADAEAVAQLNEQDEETAKTKTDEIEDLKARAQWEHTAQHQGDLSAVLAAPAITNVPDIKINGQYLSEILRNPQSTGTNHLSLVKMLTLKQVLTGDEPETVTFELPIAYDAATNLTEVHLYIDPTNSDDSDLGCDVMQMNCTRATNGDCLLVWSTIYESPGRTHCRPGCP